MAKIKILSITLSGDQDKLNLDRSNYGPNNRILNSKAPNMVQTSSWTHSSLHFLPQNSPMSIFFLLQVHHHTFYYVIPNFQCSYIDRCYIKISYSYHPENIFLKFNCNDNKSQEFVQPTRLLSFSSLSHHMWRGGIIKEIVKI